MDRRRRIGRQGKSNDILWPCKGLNHELSDIVVRFSPASEFYIELFVRSLLTRIVGPREKPENNIWRKPIHVGGHMEAICAIAETRYRNDFRAVKTAILLKDAKLEAVGVDAHSI